MIQIVENKGKLLILVNSEYAEKKENERETVENDLMDKSE